MAFNRIYPNAHHLTLEESFISKIRVTISILIGDLIVYFLLSIVLSIFMLFVLDALNLIVLSRWLYIGYWLLIAYLMIRGLIHVWMAKPFHFDGYAKTAGRGDKIFFQGQPIDHLYIKKKQTGGGRNRKTVYTVKLSSNEKTEFILSGSRNEIFSLAVEIGDVINVPIQFEPLQKTNFN